MLKKMITMGLVVVMMLAIVLTGKVVGTAAAGSTWKGDKISAPIEINIATCWSTNEAAPNVGNDYFKKKVELLSGGKITVNVHKGSLGAERGLVEDVQLGTLEAAVVTTGTLGGFVKLAEIFMIPYIFKDFNHAFACVDGVLGDRMNELCLEEGLRILDWQVTDARDLYGTGSKVMTPDDLKGKKVRVMETPFLVKLYEHYGAVATPMAYNEVYTALQQGAIDACQAGLMSCSVGHHEVSEWAARLSENITLCIFIVNNEWWVSLPKEAQDIIIQGAQEASVIARKIAKAQMEEIVNIWEKAGAEVYYADRAAFEKKAREIYPELKEMLGAANEDRWFDWIIKIGETFPVETQIPDEAYRGFIYDF